MSNLLDLNIVKINWDLAFAKENEKFAAFDADGELLFSEVAIDKFDTEMGLWVSTNTRRTNLFPFGDFSKSKDTFKNWSDLVYSRDGHVRYKNDVYSIENINSPQKIERIIIADSDSFEVKIQKLLAIIESVTQTIKVLESQNKQLSLTSPDWSNAPEWANWWAVDSIGGEGWFFENEPRLKVGILDDDEGNKNNVIYWDTDDCKLDIDKFTYPFYDYTNFHRSLTKRPE